MTTKSKTATLDPATVDPETLPAPQRRSRKAKATPDTPTDTTPDAAPPKRGRKPKAAAVPDPAGLQCECECDALSDAINLANNVIPSKTTIAILTQVLLTTAGDRLCVSVTDLGLWLDYWIPVTNANPGTLTIPGKLTKDLLSRMQGTLTLTQEESTLNLKHSSGFGNSQLRGMGSKEFPECPPIQGNPIALPSGLLVQVLEMALPTTSDNESKQLLTGINLILDTNSLEINSTDGHRCCSLQNKIDELNPDIPLNITIPAKGVKLLLRLIDLEEPVSFTYSSETHSAQFTQSNWQLTIRLLEGQYPSIQNVIQGCRIRPVQVEIDRSLLIKTIEGISPLVDHNSPKIYLDLRCKRPLVNLSTHSELGNAERIVEATVTGDFEAMRFMINPKYLLDIVKAIPTEKLCMGLPTHPHIPITLSPVIDGDFLVNEAWYIIAPIKENSASTPAPAVESKSES